MSITDDQLRAYLTAHGWAEHPDARGLWERDDWRRGVRDEA